MFTPSMPGTALKKMGPLEALRWWEAVEKKYGGSVDDIADLTDLGLTDTAEIEEALDLYVLSDLNDRYPTMKHVPWEGSIENLRLCAKIGPRLMEDDWDNAEAWGAVIDRAKGASPDLVEAFFDAGRSPSFAIQVVEMVERAEANQPGRFIAIEDLDLTQDLATLTDLVGHDLDDQDLARWEAIGVAGLATVIQTQDRVPLPQAEALFRNGVEKGDWEQYADIPVVWLDKTRDEEFTLDVLRDLARHRKVVAKWGVPWRLRLPVTSKVMRWSGRVPPLAYPVARLLIESGMSDLTAGSYLAMSMAPLRWPQGTPDPLLPMLPDTITEDLARTWASLYLLGVKPGDLSTYRWSGATTYEMIVQAACEGITPARVKHLRNTYGEPINSWTDQKKIRTYSGLLEADRLDREKAEEKA